MGTQSQILSNFAAELRNLGVHEYITDNFHAFLVFCRGTWVHSMLQLLLPVKKGAVLGT